MLSVSAAHNTNVSQGTASLSTAAPPARYGSSFLLEAVQSFQQEEEAIRSPRNELKLYLESGVELTADVITWWGVRSIIQCNSYIM
jgi:hypothetical protein